MLDQRHLPAAARYVELNSVHAGMASRPEEWPWSKAEFHLGLDEKHMLVKDRALLGLVLEGGWDELLGEVDEEAMEEVRLATRTGRPAGDGKFLGRMEKKTGRDLAAGLPGLPRKGKGRGNWQTVPGIPQN